MITAVFTGKKSMRIIDEDSNTIIAIVRSGNFKIEGAWMGKQLYYLITAEYDNDIASYFPNKITQELYKKDSLN